MRVHITGGAGSGKTTLAGRIAPLIGVAAFDLDKVMYEGGNGDERSLEDRNADIQRILALPGWVTEGVYLGWTDTFFREADLIIWLDPPWLTAIFRIFARHVRRDLSGTNPHPGYKRLFRFLQFVVRYYTHTESNEPSRELVSVPLRRYEAASVVAKYQAKAFRCRTSADIQAVVGRIRAGA